MYGAGDRYCRSVPRRIDEVARADIGVHHTAIDPYEDSFWDGCGLRLVDESGLSSHFDCILEESSFCLPRLFAENRRFDLIFIDGDVEMAPLQGNEILVVANTDSDVVFEVASQNYYVLLSGR